MVMLCVVWFACPGPSQGQVKVQVGLDGVGDHADWFQHRRVGILTNHTGRDSRGRTILEVFRQMPQVKVTALFAPEHGLFGAAEAGQDIRDNHYEQVAVYSVYGQTRKPTPAMLEDVDVLVFDMQDVGARYYTYISTLTLALEAAAEQGKPFVVLDRPNPLNGVAVEGNILDRQFASFVGMHPIPERHGMTVGELAKMINGEGWLTGHVRADLRVVVAAGWKRTMWFDQTGLTFVPPSPNIKELDAAVIYPGTCLLEGTNVSEGRGTERPFLQFGAPWLNAGELRIALQRMNLPGVEFQPAHFTPLDSKYKDQPCQGIRIQITDRQVLNAFRAGLGIV
ncbi:MAG: DUF1343 domain-containing protein, partial [Sedimentisphaerales bacterium]|nr:DUF1343 domain-containing protein [Sedimentisphaerales bacterium]